MTMRVPLDTWDKDRVDFLTSLFHVGARVRFSTSANLAQIDLYGQDGCERRIEQMLALRGWTLVGSHIGLPKGIASRIYRHPDVNAQRHRRTREQLLKFLEVNYPTIQVEEIDPRGGAVGEQSSVAPATDYKNE